MLHYQISGNGKENIVLLHGFMENLFVWEYLEEYLSSDFRIIKIDLPGHGQSKIYDEVHTMEFMAEKVKEVTDALHLTDFHILGHSMGGYVSLAFAEHFPEKLKSLTLFFSSYYADNEEKKDQRRRSFRIIKENFKTYVNAGVPNFFNPFEREKLADEIQLTKEIALSTDNNGALSAVKGMLTRTDKLELIKKLDKKILVICGRHDKAVNSYIILKNLPVQENIKSYLIDCGHNGHFEKPSICASIINTELIP
ncbi:MAG: alpha/beta hydrolase [Flavobacteriales bacterium]|nr:MAG: alpha/beta hydrolase [Flavobacteriales bacterium]